MNHPSEQLLEACALAPDDSSGAIPEDLARHLEQCAACREWVGYLRSFYEQFHRLPYSASPTLLSLIDTVRPPATVFALHPFQRWRSTDTRPVRQTTILAAASDTISTTRYHRLGVLSSEEEGVVLRLIYDAQDDVVDVFLISSEPHKHRHAIVSFPVLHLECVTDQEGRSRFRGVKKVGEIAWATQYAVVRLPVCEIPLPASGETRQSIGEPESHTVIATVDASSVAIEISPLAKKTRPITTALLSEDGTRVSVVHLEDGRGSAPVVGSPSRLVLRLYN